MPLIEFHCDSCDLIFERLIRGGSKTGTHKCKCGAEASRCLSKFGVSVKGPGFRKTDNASLDEVVGTDAEKRWEYYKDRKAAKQKLQDLNPGKKVQVGDDHKYEVVDP